MDCHKQDFVGGCIITNLKLGIEQGLYRENLDVDVISLIHLSLADNLMSGSGPMAKLRLDAIYSEFIRYHIRGIASEKGLKYLAELVKKNAQLKARI